MRLIDFHITDIRRIIPPHVLVYAEVTLVTPRRFWFDKKQVLKLCRRADSRVWREYNGTATSAFLGDGYGSYSVQKTIQAMETAYLADNPDVERRVSALVNQAQARDYYERQRTNSYAKRRAERESISRRESPMRFDHDLGIDPLTTAVVASTFFGTDDISSRSSCSSSSSSGYSSSYDSDSSSSFSGGGGGGGGGCD